MDQIYKLQPHRTMPCRASTITARRPHCGVRPTPASRVSGVFRDLADFAVLVLFQKDDPFGHPLHVIAAPLKLSGR